MNGKINLQLFNDGAAGTSAESSTQVGSSSQQQKVVYGKQEQETSLAYADGQETTSNTIEARRQEFERLIGQDYKDLFTERMQGIIDKRFKETKTMESKLQSLDPVMQLLCDKYGIKDGDVHKLANAIEDDDMYWEEAADEAGLTVEQYKYVKKMERENEQFKKARDESMREQQIRESWQNILNQSEELMATYPDFNLEQEFENPHFQSLIQAGVPVRTAYEVTHMDDIKNGIAYHTAKNVEQKVTNTIKSKSQRPRENGTRSQTGITIKSDVSKLTKEDRAEIARRVSRGEVISY